MRIGLMDVDGHNFPNLALMKISAWHKNQGDTAEWWCIGWHYDVVYKSKVFDDIYSGDCPDPPNADKIIYGGTGYNIKTKLPREIEHTYPDYDLYNIKDKAYGHLTRGCPNDCEFCIVTEKEGIVSYHAADLNEWWRGQKEIVLMDANLLACKDHETLLKQLIGSKANVDITQGLDIRLVTKDNIQLINQVNTKMIHFAWDNPKVDMTAQFEMYDKYGRIKDKRKRRVYVLTNFNSTLEEDLWRIYTLKRMDYYPYVMVYNKPRANQVYIDLQRWVNSPWTWFSCEKFEDYNRKLQ